MLPTRPRRPQRRRSRDTGNRDGSLPRLHGLPDRRLRPDGWYPTLAFLSLALGKRTAMRLQTGRTLTIVFGRVCFGPSRKPRAQNLDLSGRYMPAAVVKGIYPSRTVKESRTSGDIVSRLGSCVV